MSAIDKWKSKRQQSTNPPNVEFIQSGDNIPPDEEYEDDRKTTTADKPTQEHPSICPTGWHNTMPVVKETFGIQPQTHACLEIIRMDHNGLPVSRMYSPNGTPVKLYTDGHDPSDHDLIFADTPGLKMLQQKLPKENIELPENTVLHQCGFKYYPYSNVNYVLVVEGLASMCKGAIWAQSQATWEKYNYGAIPVIGYIKDKVEGLIDVRWPTGSTVLTRTDKEVELLTEELWGCKVEKIK